VRHARAARCHRRWALIDWGAPATCRLIRAGPPRRSDGGLHRIISKAAVLSLILSASSFAQAPAIVHVLADESQVPVGRTLQMRALVRDASGNVLRNASVTWAVNQSQAASINAAGLVTAKGLATIRVTARSGNVTGEAAIQSIPSGIILNPAEAQIDVGSTMKFQATAYDADGNLIPGVTFAWSLTNQRQGSSSLGNVDSSGMVRATGEGGAFVFATYTYNETFPGLQRQWIAYAPLKFSVPQTYRLRKLYSTLEHTRPVWKLRPRQSMLWPTDDGQLFLNASLDGLANALLNWDNGVWRVVSAGGMPRFGRGSMALEFRTHSITRDGKVLSYEDTNINGAEINLGTRDGLDPFLNNNVPFGSTEAVSSLFITRNSYTSNGWSVARANFRFPSETTTYTGLFRGAGNADEMLVSTKDALPELPGVFTIDNDFGIAADGTAFYSATSGSVRVFYRHDFNGRQKLIGVGDAVLGSKVRSFQGGRTNSTSVWFDEDGTAILCVVLEDGSTHFLSFAPDGKMSSLRVNGQSGILYRHPAQGVLLYANPYNNKGNGAHLWRGDTVSPVFVLGSRKLFDQTIQEIESGAVNGNGAITIFFRGDGNAMMVARMGSRPTEAPSLLFRDGDEVQAELPVNLFTLIGGARVGPPHAQMGGNAGSIGEFTGDDWRLTLGIGERLFGNTMWFGGSHGATYNMRKAPNGDLYFTSGSGIGRIVLGGAPQLAVQFPLRLEGNLTVNSPGQIDINGAGAILFQSSTSAGDNRIFLYLDGQAKQLLVLSPSAATASVIAGRTVQSMDSFAVDDTGRVIAQLRFRGLAVPTLAVWDGTSWTIAAMPNETRITNRLVTGLPNFPRAAGSRLISGLTVQTGGNVVAEWTGQDWSVLINVDTTMPNGQVSNSVSALDMNAQGDLLFQFANGVNSMVVRRGAKFRQVHNFFLPTPEGDFLIRTNAMDLRDDGTVYFLAVTQFDEVVLYEAVPIE
jgi:hypothetical protein